MFKKLLKRITRERVRKIRQVGANLGIINKDYVFEFGKYSGESAKTILKHNPSYLLWVHNNLHTITFNPAFLKKVKKAAMVESEHLAQQWRERLGGGEWRGALPEYDNWAGDEEDTY